MTRKRKLAIVVIALAYNCSAFFTTAQQTNWAIVSIPTIDSSFIQNEFIIRNEPKSIVQNNSYRNNESNYEMITNSQDIPIQNLTNITHSENSVFINPLSRITVLNSNNFSTWSTISGLSVSGQFSFNEGALWQGIVGQLNSSRADPAVAIGLNGNFYVGYVDLSFGQSISISSNNGQTWLERTVAPNVGSVQDKNHLWIDNRSHNMDGSLNQNEEGNLYTAWTDFGGPNNNQIVFSRSIDDGMTWSAPLNISAVVNALSHNQGVNLQTGPNGEVYACWAIYDCFPCNESAIGFTRSFDGGVNWLSAIRIISISGTRIQALGGGKSMRHSSFPVMSVNQQNGEIFIVWTQQISSGDSDIHLIKSSNGGISWGPQVRVNQDFVNRDQWFPWVACDESSGAITVIYYDSRDFSGNDRVETFVSISYNAGASWQDFQISDAGTDWSGDGIPGFSGNYAGDYIGIDVYHGLAIPIWSDNRTGNMLAYTNPFEIPCPQDLNITNGDYFITDEVNFAPDANYRVTGTINVAGAGSTYKVHPSAEVLMEAGVEIVLNDGFESEGEFQAIPNPLCTSFSEKYMQHGGKDTISSDGSLPLSKNPVDMPDMPAMLLAVQEQFNLYPNPSANGRFIISGIHKFYSTPITIFIYNVLGDIVQQVNINRSAPFQFTANIDISYQSKGMYYAKIATGSQELWAKTLVYQ